MRKSITSALVIMIALGLFAFACNGGKSGSGSGKNANTSSGYKISGNITDSSGIGVAGIPVIWQGGANATTDSAGHYTLTNIENGTYDIWTYKEGYYFNPAQRTVTVNNADVFGQDFLWTWSSIQVDSTDLGGLLYNGLDFVGLAIDSNKNAHISYTVSMGSVASSGTLKYATNSSGAWVASTIGADRGISASSLVVDSNNMVHVAYMSGYTHEVKYATNSSGSWVTSSTNVMASMESDMIDLEIDSSNKLHILVGGRRGLTYITNSSGIWVSSPYIWVNSTVNYNFKQFAALAVDSNKKAHVCFCDDGTGEQKYATNSSGSWITSTIISPSSLPTGGLDLSGCAIAIDNNTKVHMISNYQSNGVKYATNVTGTWVVSNLTTTSDSYESGRPFIAIDSHTNLHVNGGEFGSYPPSYFTNESGAWVKSANIGLRGGPLRIDSSDKMYTSFYEDFGSGIHVYYAESK